MLASTKNGKHCTVIGGEDGLVGLFGFYNEHGYDLASCILAYITNKKRLVKIDESLITVPFHDHYSGQLGIIKAGYFSLYQKQV